MVNTHYMVDGHPIHNKDPYNGYYKSRFNRSQSFADTLSQISSRTVMASALCWR
jgi:hypothetical protein